MAWLLRDRPRDLGVVPYGGTAADDVDPVRVGAGRAALQGLALAARARPFWLLAGGFFVASLARYLVTRRGPGWLSLRILAWTTTVVVGSGALLAWLNLSAFQPSLGPAAARRALIVAFTLGITACVLLLIAVVHYGFGRRGSRVGGALLGIAVLAAVLLPLVARGPAEPAPGPVRAVRSIRPP